MSSDSITLTNGVVVTKEQQTEALLLVSALIDYSRDILQQPLGQTNGIVGSLVGYVHGHTRRVPKKWHYALRTLGIMDDNNEIPLARQWALVSVCCKGERLGRFANDKLRA